MALGTLLKVSNVLVGVNPLYLGGFMGVAVVTGICHVTSRMAYLAGRRLAAVSDRKRVSPQHSGSPASGRVTDNARLAILANMGIRSRVALDAGTRFVIRAKPEMTPITRYPDVLSVERVGGGVVKSGKMVRTVVTGEARIAVRLAMVRDETCILALMAACTRGDQGHGFLRVGLRRE